MLYMWNYYYVSYTFILKKEWIIGIISGINMFCLFFQKSKESMQNVFVSSHNVDWLLSQKIAAQRVY